jgi:hypothetical protein
VAIDDDPAKMANVKSRADLRCIGNRDAEFVFEMAEKKPSDGKQHVSKPAVFGCVMTCPHPKNIFERFPAQQKLDQCPQIAFPNKSIKVRIDKKLIVLESHKITWPASIQSSQQPRKKPKCGKTPINQTE